MIDCQISVHIDAPPTRVWDALLDVERWHEWTASITSIQLLDSAPLRIGSRASVHQPGLPAGIWQITHLDPACGIFNWATHSLGVNVIGCHLIEPAGSGARAILWLEFTGFLAPVFVWLLHGQNRRYVSMEAAGLKRRSEESAAAPPQAL
jgi:hypothetical protein